MGSSPFFLILRALPPPIVGLPPDASELFGSTKAECQNFKGIIQQAPDRR